MSWYSVRALRQAVAGAAAIAVLAGGCGSEGDNAAGDTRIAALANEPGLSEFQQGLLEDGLITSAEYEQAVYRAVGCLEDYGFRDIILDLDREGFSIDFAYPGSVITDEDSRAADSCFADSLSAVDPGYAELNGPSAEEEAAWRQRLERCAAELLVKAGLYTEADVADLSQDQLAEAMNLNASSVDRCADA